MHPVIDLGDVTDRPPAPADDPLPPLNRRLARRLLIAAVTALSAFTLGASALPAPPAVRVVWEMPVEGREGVTLAGDTVFAHRLIDGQALLTAHDLADGRTIWAHPTGQEVGTVMIQPEAGLLLVRGDLATVTQEHTNGNNSVLMYYRETIALSPATGDRLWTGHGEPLAVGADGVLLENRDVHGVATTLSLVGARDGKPLWSRSTPGVQSTTVGYQGERPDRVITATDRGDVTVQRYADGEPLLSRRLPWTAADPGTVRDTYLMTVGDRLLVIRTDVARSTVTAYHLDTLEELWEATTDSFPRVVDCGPVLCLLDDHALAGLDLTTGRARWQVPGIGSVPWVGNGRLLADDNTDSPTQQLIDAEDGRRIGTGLDGRVPYRYGDIGSLLILRTTTDPVGHTVVTRLDPDTGARSVIGLIRTPDDHGCEVAEHHLLCRTDGRLVVSTTG